MRVWLLLFLRRWQNWLAALGLIFAALVGIRLWPHESLSKLAPSSVAVYDNAGHLLRLTLAGDDRYRLWMPLKDMPPALVQGVLLHEDAWFRWHPGFNPISLVRGGWMYVRARRHRQGGSTVTMQFARLACRLNTRTPGGKLRQVMRALELELCYSKNDILEAYLELRAVRPQHRRRRGRQPDLFRQAGGAADVAGSVHARRHAAGPEPTRCAKATMRRAAMT